jgi:hypothetical protein
MRSASPSTTRASPPDFDALLVLIIDQEQLRLGIFRKIAGGDVLPIAGEIDKPDGRFVQHHEESGRAAAMLNIGLPLGICRGEKNAGLRADEGRQIRRNAGLPGAFLFHARICMPRAVSHLDGFDRWRERNVAGIDALDIHRLFS